MSNRQTEEFMMEGAGGGVIPTPTWSWSFSGDTTSEPAGNDGANAGADLVNDSGGKPNEAYQFISANSDRMVFDPANIGSGDFSLYLQFDRDSGGEQYADILSTHTTAGAAGGGWNMERVGTTNNFNFTSYLVAGGYIQSGVFALPIGELSKMFLIKSGTNILIYRNDILVASNTGFTAAKDSAEGLTISGWANLPTARNADITVDGMRIWHGTALTAEEQTAQIEEGI